jgi:hypothetical protein
VQKKLKTGEQATEKAASKAATKPPSERVSHVGGPLPEGAIVPAAPLAGRGTGDSSDDDVEVVGEVTAADREAAARAAAVELGPGPAAVGGGVSTPQPSWQRSLQKAEAALATVTEVADREQQIGGSGGSLEPPGLLS